MFIFIFRTCTKNRLISRGNRSKNSTSTIAFRFHIPVILAHAYLSAVATYDVIIITGTSHMTCCNDLQNTRQLKGRPLRVNKIKCLTMS